MDQQVAMELLTRAKEAYEPGRYMEAMDLVQQVIDGRPVWPAMGHALQCRAIIASETGDLENAQRYWQEFIADGFMRDYPDASMALSRYNWAYCLRLLGQYAEAVKQYEAAAVIMRQHEHPYLARVLHNLAWCSMLLNETALADAAIREAGTLELSGDDMGNQVLCEAFYAHLHGDDVSARQRCLELIDRAETENGQRSHAAWLLGNVALAAQDVSSAQHWADQAEQYAAGDPCQFRLLSDVQSLRSAVARAAEAGINLA